MRRIMIVGLAALALWACASTDPAGSAGSSAACAALAGRAPDDVRLETSWETPGPDWMPVAGVDDQALDPASVRAPFCRVRGVIETEIEFELWLPARSGWNGKFLGAGVGGDAGRLNFADLARGLMRGYAAATTNTGHRASDVAWMLGPRERLANYEVRANHLLAENGKAIVEAFYGERPRRSYFIGCSGGGRQGLKEMQRFPADYDGIISGANGPRTSEMTARRMWELHQRDTHPWLMSPDDWRLVADAGVAACDALDGVRDGVIADPTQCRFEVRALQCAGAKTPACLSADQVAFASRFYAPLTDEDGRRIDDGLLPGVLVDTGRSQVALGVFGRAIRGRTDWDGADFVLRDDLPALDRLMPELRADETDLHPFRDRGGRVIMYTGWSDGAVPARQVTAYYEAVEQAMGGSSEDFMRLYMLPGVFHCRGGPGDDLIGGSGADAPIVDARHDLLSALEAWVETARAPEAMVASRIQDGAVSHTRLICPYPQRAVHDGVGNPNVAESYRCDAAR